MRQLRLLKLATQRAHHNPVYLGPSLLPQRRFVASVPAERREDLLRQYNQFFEHKSIDPLPRDVAKLAEDGTEVSVHGFVGKRVKGGDESLTLVDMTTVEGHSIQLASTSAEILDQIRSVSPFSPVRVSGTVRLRLRASKPSSASLTGESVSPSSSSSFSSPWSLQVTSIHSLNSFPRSIIISKGVQFPPQSRHLQIRFEHDLRARLDYRSRLKQALAAVAGGDEADGGLGYTDIETPLLFKSTPEGAREFLVPTRRKGFAYALPQSPQQYKQALMSSGVSRYMQFARCFRDEDLRADRQPEFTQLDLERSFATGEDVMNDVETIVVGALERMRSQFGFAWTSDASWVPVPVGKSAPQRDSMPYPKTEPGFPRVTYDDCIRKYGSDKPDLRIPHQIFRFPDNEPIREFIGKTSNLSDPIVEACVIRIEGGAPVPAVREAVAGFMANLGPSHTANPHGGPQVLIYDSSLPLNGLSSLGFEGADGLTSSPGSAAAGLDRLVDGDVIIFQARDDSPPEASTRLGELRAQLWVELRRLDKRPRPSVTMDLRFLWVTDFPMFTREYDDNGTGKAGVGADPAAIGQGGSSGFSATHHPFTAPRTVEDFALLFSDPLRARADHYDLVLNGVEIGGGSRRIHAVEVQEFVMRDVLRMTPTRLAQFSHLLDALRAGCPPHAGFAVGFDRFCAVMSGTASVRDVIAFPKSKKGEDMFARAPGRLTEKELEVYHLQVGEK